MWKIFHQIISHIPLAVPILFYLLQLYGMDSSDGRIVWESFILDAGTFHSNNKHLLFQLRSAVHYPLLPVAILLAQSKVTL